MRFWYKNKLDVYNRAKRMHGTDRASRRRAMKSAYSSHFRDSVNYYKHGLNRSKFAKKRGKNFYS